MTQQASKSEKHNFTLPRACALSECPCGFSSRQTPEAPLTIETRMLSPAKLKARMLLPAAL